MHKPAHAHEVFLNPGDFYFGAGATCIVTVLGSCVSFTAWHPFLHIGGMCHFILPARGTGKKEQNPDGRYADEAVQLLLHEIALRDTRPHEYQVKIFGGGNMFPHLNKPRGNGSNHVDVGSRNIEAARMLLEEQGFRISTGHVGSDGHRKLIFNLWDGDVWVRHVKEHKNQELETSACSSR